MFQINDDVIYFSLNISFNYNLGFKKRILSIYIILRYNINNFFVRVFTVNIEMSVFGLFMLVCLWCMTFLRNTMLSESLKKVMEN